MYRICSQKSTGKFIEAAGCAEIIVMPRETFKTDEAYEKHLTECEALEDYRDNALIGNAITAGYNKDDIEVRRGVTLEEYEVLMEALIPEPTKEQLYETAIKAKEKEIIRRQAIAAIEAEQTK